MVSSLFRITWFLQIILNSLDLLRLTLKVQFLEKISFACHVNKHDQQVAIEKLHQLVIIKYIYTIYDAKDE